MVGQLSVTEKPVPVSQRLAEILSTLQNAETACDMSLDHLRPSQEPKPDLPTIPPPKHVFDLVLQITDVSNRIAQKMGQVVDAL